MFENLYGANKVFLEPDQQWQFFPLFWDPDRDPPFRIHKFRDLFVQRWRQEPKTLQSRFKGGERDHTVRSVRYSYNENDKIALILYTHKCIYK